MDKSELTARERKVFEVVAAFVARGINPSFRDIAPAAGLHSTNTVSYNLDKLERKGYVQVSRNRARSIRLVNKALDRLPAAEVLRIPLYGKIVAGSPIPVPDPGTSAYEADGEGLTLHRAILPTVAPDRLFALQVKGDSMIDAGILDGDTVVLQSIGDKDEVKNGDLVAAWLESKQMTTLKRIYMFARKIELRPENPRYDVITVRRKKDVRVMGKVVYVTRLVGNRA